MNRLNVGMFLRGMSKVMFIAVLANLFLTNLFEFLAEMLDLELDRQALVLFSYMTCGLLTMWLQSDARRAFAFARAHGYVTAKDKNDGDLQVATDCPKRWLVILFLELNPGATGLRR